MTEDMNVSANAQALDSSGAKPTPEAVKPTNPQQVPESGKVQDAGRYVLEERKGSPVPIDPTPTTQFTSGSMRAIMARRALPQVPRANEYNANEDTNSVHPLPLFADDVGLTLMIRGCNLINPFSLPIVDPNTCFQSSGEMIEAALEPLFFGGNGPSISTVGTVKRAEVEAKMSVIKSVIVGYYNRSIPFTDYGTASRLLVLAAYESETLKLQSLFEALRWLKGLADYQVKVGVKLSAGWQAFYEPGVYSKLAQLYQMVAALPVVDTSSHDRLQSLCAITGATKDQEYPAALHMQNVGVFRDPNWEGKFAQSGSNETHIDSIVPNCSIAAVWAAAADGSLENLLQEFIKQASSIITQYEIVYSALTQLISKGAMEGRYLSEWIPGSVDGAGSFVIQSSDPVFDWTSHERFEYAPYRYQGEVGSLGTINTYAFNLFTLPNAATDGNAANLKGIRPVGKGHYDEAFDIEEIVGLGLFREHAAITNHCSYVNSGGVVTYVDSTPAYVWVDAVYGDFYTPSTENVINNRTGIESRVVLYGLSFYASGLHNVIDMPMKRGTYTLKDEIYYVDGTAYAVQAPAFSSAQKEEPVRWIWTRVCEELCLHYFIIERKNASGVRQMPLVVTRGYPMCDNFEMNLIAVDNALANAYGEFILDVKMKEVKAISR